MHDDFVRALRDACRDLFAAYDLVLHPVDEQIDEQIDDCGIAGVIGFSGDGIRGSLVLASVPTVSRSTCPILPGDVGAATEWMGELANQLLGRLKNHHFWVHGVNLRMSLPVAATGRDFSCILGDPSRRFGPISFRSAAGPIVLWSHIMMDDGFVMGPRPDGQCAVEGALELF